MYFQLCMKMLPHWKRVFAGQPNRLIWIKVKVSPQMFTKHSLNDGSCARFNYSKYVEEVYHLTLSMCVRVLTMVNHNPKAIKKEIRCELEKTMLKETAEKIDWIYQSINFKTVWASAIVLTWINRVPITLKMKTKHGFDWNAYEPPSNPLFASIEIRWNN